MAARRLYPLMRLPLNPMAMKFQTGQALNSPVSESAAFAYGTVFNRLPAGNMYMNVSHDGFAATALLQGILQSGFKPQSLIPLWHCVGGFSPQARLSAQYLACCSARKIKTDASPRRCTGEARFLLPSAMHKLVRGDIRMQSLTVPTTISALAAAIAENLLR